jgi:hypothetical protein
MTGCFFNLLGNKIICLRLLPSGAFPSNIHNQPIRQSIQLNQPPLLKCPYKRDYLPEDSSQQIQGRI